MLTNIVESPEIAPDVIEDPIQDDANAAAVQIDAYLAESLIIAQAPVNVIVINGVVAMRRGFEDRSKVQCIHAHAAQMGNPFVDLFQPGYRRGAEVVAGWSAAETERIDVIKKRIIGPVILCSVHSRNSQMNYTYRLVHKVSKKISRKDAVHELVDRIVDQCLV